MKTKTYLCICLLAAAVSYSALASAKKAASPAPSASPVAAADETKPARAIPYHGMISAVDARAKTFTIAGKEKSRVFKITDRSAIMKAGVPAKMKDVTANEEVRGSYWKMDDGGLEAKSVKLGPMTDAEKAARKTSKKKDAADDSSPRPNALPAKQ